MALTSRSDMGVLSPSGRCCSRASTIQLAMMVARIMYSNGVRGLRTAQEAPKERRAEEAKAESAQCSSLGQATSRGAEKDRGRSPPRPSRPHPPGLPRGTPPQSQPPAAQQVPVAVSTADSASSAAPPGSRAPREGAERPQLEAEGRTARRRTLLPTDTRSHMYLHRHVNIHVPRVPNARTRSTGFMQCPLTRRHLQPGARTGSRPPGAHTYTDTDSPSGALQAGRALCTQTG